MDHNKKIVIGIPVKNTGKFLYNLLDQLRSLNYNKKLIKIAFVEGDSFDDSYDICEELKNKILDFDKIELHKLDFNFHLEHNEGRWKQETFKFRIKNLVNTRNYIVDNFTQDCDYLWWVDSDFEIIPRDTLNLLKDDQQLIITDGIYNPINSGMISLVFKATRITDDSNVIIKIKRRNIENKLDDAIDNLVFFMYILS